MEEEELEVEPELLGEMERELVVELEFSTEKSPLGATEAKGVEIGEFEAKVIESDIELLMIDLLPILPAF